MVSRPWLRRHPLRQVMHDEGGIWGTDQQVWHDGEWITVTLTLAGPLAWGEALMARCVPGGFID